MDIKVENVEIDLKIKVGLIESEGKSSSEFKLDFGGMTEILSQVFKHKKNFQNPDNEKEPSNLNKEADNNKAE